MKIEERQNTDNDAISTMFIFIKKVVFSLEIPEVWHHFKLISFPLKELMFHKNDAFLKQQWFPHVLFVLK